MFGTPGILWEIKYALTQYVKRTKTKINCYHVTRHANSLFLLFSFIASLNKAKSTHNNNSHYQIKFMIILSHHIKRKYH